MPDWLDDAREREAGPSGEDELVRSLMGAVLRGVGAMVEVWS